jgi:serine/threonine protein kinase
MSNGESTLVGGRYELGEVLGRGGMAEVRKGTDTRLGRVVAVKRLRTDLAADATFQARFRREAQSSASLNHPSIVAVYDTGEEMSTDGTDVAQPYIVMEYVAGRTLRDIIREGRKILPERALELTSGVLSALDYSHRAGIIHRDIKPGNVMLTPAGDVKVMDFGIARAVSDASSTMTQTAAVVGTAQYLSPEQARGETVDSRSDVYSTGCLLYELLTGRPPFVGDSPVAVAYQHVREPALPPSAHDTALPPELDAIVMKSLAKRVEDRYQSAAAMRTDIERYLAGRPVQAPAVLVPETSYLPATAGNGNGNGATGHLPMADPAPYPSPEEEEPRNRTPLIIALVALLVASLVAAAFLLPKLFESPPKDVQIPNVVGEKQKVAETTLRDAGFQVDTEVANSDSVPDGNVISQDPNGDTYAAPDSTVTITVSTGKRKTTVPSVLGKKKEEARTLLEDANLVPEFEEVESDEEKGTVVELSRDEGESVAEGSEIIVGVSDGKEKVPYVVGMTQEQAEEAIRDRMFEATVVPDADSDRPRGEVVRQDPKSGTILNEGSQVVIYVSAREDEPTEPTDPTDPTDPTTTPTDGEPTDFPTDDPFNNFRREPFGRAD